MKPKKGDLVKVEWVDSCNHAVSWTEKGEPGYKVDLMKVMSVGWVVRSTKQLITLMQNTTPDGQVFNGVTIPSRCITKISRLK